VAFVASHSPSAKHLQESLLMPPYPPSQTNEKNLAAHSTLPGAHLYKFLSVG